MYLTVCLEESKHSLFLPLRCVGLSCIVHIRAVYKDFLSLPFSHSKNMYMHMHGAARIVMRAAPTFAMLVMLVAAAAARQLSAPGGTLFKPRCSSMSYLTSHVVRMARMCRPQKIDFWTELPTSACAAGAA